MFVLVSTNTNQCFLPDFLMMKSCYCIPIYNGKKKLQPFIGLEPARNIM